MNKALSFVKDGDTFLSFEIAEKKDSYTEESFHHII
jgi:hypothetical protein